ncbi:cell division initiation protein [Lactobacillus bombicola]|uniref:Cell division initiation protein n=1 Tax=Lactobacillus bombicola TaxID=1505723 RepID=A0A1I1QZM2_9LACO|nr:DivIVA domain-containing protein [Lactobacillus bombicola]MCO6528292.1 DivIVA domain-containing protein [Lactobacillus sp.]SFD27601.1 cell division initiation protein [Lactobacillus bombicola]
MASKKIQIEPLTPMDIHKQEFKKRGLSGYDRHEVDSFLDRIVNDYGDALDQIADLKNEIVQLQGQADKFKKQVAEYHAIESKKQAIITEAKEKAQKIITDATIVADNKTAQALIDADYQRQQLETIKFDYERVKKEVAGYRNYIQELLQKAIANLADEKWQKALDHYFSTERFYPPDGSEPLTLTDADEEIDEDDEVDNEAGIEVNFEENIDDSHHSSQLIEGDSPNISFKAVDSTSMKHARDKDIVFSDNNKDNN